MLDGHRIANGETPFSSFGAFRASELDTKQTPGSDTFISEIDPIIGTDHPSLTSLSFTGELAIAVRFTGFQLAAGVGSNEDGGAGATDVFERFGGTSTEEVELVLGCCATGINDASAPERSSSKSCGIVFRSSAEKPLVGERTDEAVTRRERREAIHALRSNDYARMNCANRCQNSG